MLTRAIKRAAPVTLVVAAFVLFLQQAGHAGTGPGGGPFGSVQCGQAFAPSCVVSAGSPGGSTDTTAAGGTTGSSLGAASGQQGGGGSGCVTTVGTVGCPLPVGGAAAPPAGGGGGAAPPPPAVLAQFAVRFLVLPGPVIQSSPSAGDLQLTHLPTWLWISRAVWTPRSQTAAVPGEQVTATATPVSVLWRMGDGVAVVCRGPGTPYSSRFDPASASPDCGHTYAQSSAGQPGGAYQVTATITWDITWTGTGGVGGTLPPLATTSVAAFRVAESQAINTSPGGQ